MEHYIHSQAQLDALIPALQEATVVAVDTEFLREKTYHAKLCLVQLGLGEHQYCVDVLSIDDLSSLQALFANKQVLKLFHAARQDFEVIYQRFNVVPEPVFDTQLAAAFNGKDMQIGLAGLVKDELDIDVASSQARTDWTARPLSEAQLHYAAEDVTYLNQLYQSALDLLSNANKLTWFEEEILALSDHRLYNIEPEDAWQRVQGGNMRPKQQHSLKQLAIWRETMAQQKNIPRSWVLKDSAMFDIANQSPKDMGQLARLNVLGKRGLPTYGEQIIEMLTNLSGNFAPIWPAYEPFSREEKSHCSQMIKLVRDNAEQLKIAQALLATRKDIEALWRGNDKSRLLKGWRADVIGNQLNDYVSKNK